MLRCVIILSHVTVWRYSCINNGIVSFFTHISLAMNLTWHLFNHELFARENQNWNKKTLDGTVHFKAKWNIRKDFVDNILPLCMGLWLTVFSKLPESFKVFVTLILNDELATWGAVVTCAPLRLQNIWGSFTEKWKSVQGFTAQITHLTSVTSLSQRSGRTKLSFKTWFYSAYILHSLSLSIHLLLYLINLSLSDLDGVEVLSPQQCMLVFSQIIIFSYCPHFLESMTLWSSDLLYEMTLASAGTMEQPLEGLSAGWNCSIICL